jgi:hypothetical protein
MFDVTYRSITGKLSERPESVEIFLIQPRLSLFISLFSLVCLELILDFFPSNFGFSSQLKRA